MPEANWRPLISKFGYSVGFLLVILGRQQLFTENTLTPVLPLVRNRTVRQFLEVMRLWGVVLFANLLGSLAVAWVAGHTSAFTQETQHEFTEIGIQAMKGSFSTIIISGIFAGWLIALMVWLLPFAESARIWVIIFLNYLVGYRLFQSRCGGCGANFLCGRNWGEFLGCCFLGGYMVPTLLGNILGGVALVAALHHAQVVSGKDE